MQNKLIFNRGTANEVILRGKDIISVTLTEMMNSSEGISIGATCSNKLTADIIVPSGLAPAASDVEAYAVKGEEEYPLGKFYVCNVETVNDYRTATIECYDKFCKTEEIYLPDVKPVPEAAEEEEESPAPKPRFLIKDILEDIAGRLGIEVAFDMTPYQEAAVTDIEGYTYRQMIGYIAGFMGKNACFDREGRLDFRWYEPTGAVIERKDQYQGQFNLLAGGSVYIGSITSGTENEVLSAGEGMGISFENPFMTQEQLAAVLAGLSDFSYHPCSLRYRGAPDIKAGDLISAEDEAGNLIKLCVMEQATIFNGGMQSEIQCYGQSEESYSFSAASSASKVTAALGRRLESTVRMGREIKNSKGGYFQIADLDGDGVSDTFVLRTGANDGNMVIGNKDGIGFSRDGGRTITTALNQDGICTEALQADELWGSALLIEGVTAQDILRADRDETTGEIFLEIGSSRNSIVLRQENDRIVFYNKSAESEEERALCYIDPASFVMKNLGKVQFGGLSIYPNNNGKIIFSTGGNN